MSLPSTLGVRVCLNLTATTFSAMCSRWNFAPTVGSNPEVTGCALRAAKDGTTTDERTDRGCEGWRFDYMTERGLLDFDELRDLVAAEGGEVVGRAIAEDET